MIRKNRLKTILSTLLKSCNINRTLHLCLLKEKWKFKRRLLCEFFDEFDQSTKIVWLENSTYLLVLMFKSFGRKIFQWVTFSKIFFPTITKKFKSLGQARQHNVLNTCAHHVANLTRSTKTQMNFFLHKNMTLPSAHIYILFSSKHKRPQN